MAMRFALGIFLLIGAAVLIYALIAYAVGKATKKKKSRGRRRS